jgi:hypothetical protein
MDLGMTVGASPVENVASRCQLRSSGVPRGRVTLLAQPGGADLQQLGAHRAVRVMAIEAVLHDRRVLPKEGAAALRVALVAGLIDGGCDEKFWVGSSVRVVAVRAGDHSLSKRHVGGALEFGPAHRMTPETDLHFRALGKRQVIGERLRELGGHHIGGVAW